MSKWLNPEHIYPKRLGIYRDCALVIEYYHIGEDKFKKHLIPFNRQDSIDIIVDSILRNQKHAPFLKKVQAKYIRNVIAGETVDVFPGIGDGEKDRNRNRNIFHRQDQNEFSQPANQSQYTEQRQREEANHSKQSGISSDFARDYNGNSSVVDDSSVLRQSEISLGNVHQPDLKKAEEDAEEYYDEGFEEFELSHSQENFKKKTDEIIQEPIKPPPQVEEEKPKKKKEKKDPALEGFDFIDDQSDKKDKKKKKKKKDKSKDKKDKKKEKERADVPMEEEFEFL